MNWEMPHNLPEPDLKSFSAESCFLGIARRALASQHDVQVLLPHVGDVILSPTLHAYHAAVSDMPEFCRTDASRFTVTVLKKADKTPRDNAEPMRPITELLWQAGFHASQGRLLTSYANGEPVRILDVIRFRRWPNLTRLPTTANTMRICALLTRHPSSLALVSRKLGIEQQEVFQVCSAACAAGIAYVACGQTATAQEDRIAPDAPQREPGVWNALFNRIVRL